MHIPANRPQITRVPAIHQQRLVTSAEQMPGQLVPPVEARRVSSQQPLHARHQIRLGRLHHQVKMIGHQAKGLNLPSRLGATLRQRFEEQRPVSVIQKNSLTPVAAIHHMINRAGKLDSQLASHAANIILKRINSQ